MFYIFITSFIYFIFTYLFLFHIYSFVVSDVLNGNVNVLIGEAELRSPKAQLKFFHRAGEDIKCQGCTHNI